MVPAARVKAVVKTLVELRRRFTPEERLPKVARASKSFYPSAPIANDVDSSA